MKFVALASLLLLVACQDERTSSVSKGGHIYYVECIDGVEYWLHTSGVASHMALRVDPETLTFVKCNMINKDD